MVFSDESTQSSVLNIIVDGRPSNIRKSTLVHMVQNGTLKISSDLLKKVQAPDRQFPSLITPLLDTNFEIKDEIMIGDSILIYDIVDQYSVTGTVFAFQFINRRTKKETSYSGIKIIMRSDDANTLSLMLA